jgi:hypothetical protein
MARMFDDFWGERWDFGAKHGKRPFRAWENRSTSGRLPTVFVNSSGKLRAHFVLYPHPSTRKNGRDRFDKDSGSATSFALSASFRLKEANIRRSMLPWIYTCRVPWTAPEAVSHVTHGCAAHHSRRFPTFRLKNRRTFTLFTIQRI